MPRYAMIDKNGKLTGVCFLKTEVKKDTLIPIDNDFEVGNKKWNGSSWEDYTPPEPPTPEPTQLDRIEEIVNKNADELRAEGAAMASVNLMAVGAEMTMAMAAAKMDVPATAGTFAEQWEEWTPDGETAEDKSLWNYKGVGYQARTDIQKIEVYAPDVATNNYAVRPIPDVNGVYPGMVNMDVDIGMKVRDWEDGKVYVCYANPITSLQWAPHTVSASFELYGG